MKADIDGLFKTKNQKRKKNSEIGEDHIKQRVLATKTHCATNDWTPFYEILQTQPNLVAVLRFYGPNVR